MPDAAAVEATPKAISLAAWKKAKVHTVRIPSGVYVDIQIPDLPELIKAGSIPNNLLDAALGAVNGTTKIDAEFVVQQAEFTNRLLTFTLVSPTITEEDAKDIPVEDKTFIAEIATRQRDMDAEYNHIGGLHTSESFRRFRGLSDGDTGLEDL